MTKRYSIEEIEKLLSEATPGPWVVGEDGIDWAGILNSQGAHVAGRLMQRDAELIAAAPTIIRQLIAERNAYKEIAVLTEISKHEENDSFILKEIQGSEWLTQVTIPRRKWAERLIGALARRLLEAGEGKDGPS